MRFVRGVTFIEIIISLIILSSAIMVAFGVMAQGLLAVSKGKNMAVATNIAQAQFEAYKGNFHMIPFHGGVTVGNYRYPDESNANDSYQIGKFVNHSINVSDIPADTYYGTDNFYANAPAPPNGNGNGISPYYDLNKDGYTNDLLEPLPSTTVEGITYTTVVEIAGWNNGNNINNIKHMIVTVYWKEKDTIGGGNGDLKLKNVTYEGYIARTQPNPW